ncbi:MAG: TonB family protein [Candidatus Azobacteroides sp.]|nr:TonB family protein [Candidatus Azobacteroides sp.]
MKDMVQDVNLTSQEWCDLIFQGKNKQYGAYVLRQTSGKRHVYGIIAVCAFIGMVVALPYFIRTVTSGKDTFEYKNTVVLIDPTVNNKTETPPNPIVEPPKPLPRASIMYVPPKIVDKVTDNQTNIPITQSVIESDAVVGIATVKGNPNSGRPADTDDNVSDVVITGTTDPTICLVAEQQPEFPGGISELMKFLSSHLKYPQAAIDMGIEGKVTVQFVVSKTGAISGIKVLQSLNPVCDKEAVRLISSMPNWIPGRQNGYPVSVYYTIPIRFKITPQ